MVEAAIDSFFNTSLSVSLYIVDNSPTDALASLSSDTRIEYHHVGANIGFGAANNVILKQNEKLGKYHLVLNPDIVIEPGTLEALVDFMDKNIDVGGVNPMLKYPGGAIQHVPKLFPTPLDLFRRFVPGLIRIFPRYEQRYTLSLKPADTPYEVNIISGCFMMLRSSLLETHIFDERFFMYFEDFDLSRILSKNARLMVIPHVSVIHHYARGAHKNWSLFKLFIISMVKYFNKYGWLFDKYRRRKNEEILSKFKSKMKVYCM